MKDRFEVENEGDLYTDLDKQYARGRLGKTPSDVRMKKEDFAASNLAARGMGKTGITRKPILDAERLTICMLRGKGLSYAEIGDQLKRSKDSIVSVIHAAEKASRAMGLNYDWKADIKEKSIVGLREALVETEDPYKRGSLSIAALKGLGEFETDGAVNLGVLMNAVPMAARGRYVSLEPEPPPVEQLPEKSDSE